MSCLFTLLPIDGHAALGRTPPNSEFIAVTPPVIVDRHRQPIDTISDYAPKLKASFIKHGLDAAIAEDLACEVIAAAQRDQVTADDDALELSTRLFIAARATMASYSRGRIAIHDPALSSAAPSHALSVPNAPQGAKVQQCLRQLAPDDRQLVEWLYFRNVPRNEIGRMLGIPAEKVKDRIASVLGQLRTSPDGGSTNEN